MHPAAITFFVIAACGFGLVSADSHADTRYGTKHWIGAFLDEESCGKTNYGGCYPKEADVRNLLWDQFDRAFEDLCKDVSCEGSYGIKLPGDGCDSRKLGHNTAYDLYIEAEYTHGDRNGVKEAFMNTIRTLNKVEHDCSFYDGKGVNAVKIYIPTDIHIVRDTGDHGLRSTMHISLDKGGDGACDVVNTIWSAISGAIPGGPVFGAILKGTCR